MIKSNNNIVDIKFKVNYFFPQNDINQSICFSKHNKSIHFLEKEIHQDGSLFIP